MKKRRTPESAGVPLHMTSAEALLSVLAPGFAFLGTLATLSVRRHFKFVDNLEKRLGDYLEKSASSQALVAEEMRLSRLAREEQDKEVAELIVELEDALGKKIEDRRHSELRAMIEELRSKRVKSDPPKGGAECDAPTLVAEEASAAETSLRRRAKTDPRMRAVVEAPAGGQRASLGSRSGR